MYYRITYNDEETNKKLNDKEIKELIKKSQQGDEKSRDKLSLYSVRLIIYILKKYFNNIEKEENDLIHEGMIGLLKSIDTFDLSKNIKFSSYASKCIKNQMLMYLNRVSKNNKCISMNQNIDIKEKARPVTLCNILSDKKDYTEDYDNTEMQKIIRNIIDELPDRNKQIIKLYFGIGFPRCYLQSEIREIVNISQPQISRSIQKSLKIIEYKLRLYECIECKENENIKTKKLTK